GAAHTAKPPMGAMTKMRAGKMHAMNGAAHASASVHGVVKGAPSGKTFTVAVPKKGAVTVDASGAKIRVAGKFAAMSAIKAGSMQGTTLKATEVTVHARGAKMMGHSAHSSAMMSGRPKQGGGRRMPPSSRQ